MIPQMIRAGYDKYYATGLCAVAGGLGVIVSAELPDGCIWLVTQQLFHQ